MSKECKKWPFLWEYCLKERESPTFCCILRTNCGIKKVQTSFFRSVSLASETSNSIFHGYERIRDFLWEKKLLWSGVTRTSFCVLFAFWEHHIWLNQQRHYICKLWLVVKIYVVWTMRYKIALFANKQFYVHIDLSVRPPELK